MSVYVDGFHRSVFLVYGDEVMPLPLVMPLSLVSF
jgi:hypothetical protein